MMRVEQHGQLELAGHRRVARRRTRVTSGSAKTMPSTTSTPVTTSSALMTLLPSRQAGVLAVGRQLAW